MKKICFVTSGRADYGLLYWSMKEVQNSSDFELQLIVTGTHLSPEFGNTYEQIEKDGFQIDEKLSLGHFQDSNLSMCSQVAHAITGIASVLGRLQPDLVIILGDRYEMLGVAQGAFFLRKPIMHFHGGEVTEGAIDDTIRHAITKLSNYHLTSTSGYRQRVIQLGEHPDTVYTAGACGLESFNRLKLLTKEDIEAKINFNFLEKNLLITFHPVTIMEESIDELINALEDFGDVGQVITLPNSDPGHVIIRERLMKYATGKRNVFVTNSLGQLNYNSIMKFSDVVVGNSSSGIIEAPFAGTMTLNIGDRQKGRVSDNNFVKNVVCEKNAIVEGLKELLNKPVNGKKSLVYGDGDFSKTFMSILSSLKLNNTKIFYDLP